VSRLRRAVEHARRLGAAGDVGVIRRRRTDLLWRDGKLERQAFCDESRVWAWLASAGKQAYVTATGATELASTVDQAIAIARHQGSPATRPAVTRTAHDAAAPGPPVQPRPTVLRPFTTLSTSSVAGRSIEIRLTYEHRSVRLAGSDDFEGGYEDATATLRIRVDHRDNARRGSCVIEDSASSVEELGAMAEAAVATAGRRAAADALSVPLREEPPRVVLDPMVATRVLRLLVPSVQLDSVILGRSRWEDAVGAPVASPCVTIFDNAQLEGGPMAAPFDDEGTSTRVVELVEQGVLQRYLADTRSGAQAGVPSTGSGWRGKNDEMPTVRPSCFVLEADGGIEATSDLALGSGWLWVLQAHGVHVANDITGDFSFGARGVLADGSPSGRPVHGFTLAGNVFDLIRHIELSIGKVHFTRAQCGYVGSPGLCVSGGLSIGV
jgi:predicted Zn-dependent protease